MFSHVHGMICNSSKPCLDKGVLLVKERGTDLSCKMTLVIVQGTGCIIAILSKLVLAYCITQL